MQQSVRKDLAMIEGINGEEEVAGEHPVTSNRAI